MQRHDGRGELARTRRQIMEGRGGRDEARMGREGEGKQGELRARSHDEREATRLGEGVGQRK